MTHRLPVCEDRRVVALKAAIHDFHGGSVIHLTTKSFAEISWGVKLAEPKNIRRLTLHLFSEAERCNTRVVNSDKAELP